jgi:predicted MFS family arabinose efflux permease
VPATRGLSSGLVLAGTALIGTCYGFARFAYGLFAPQLGEEFALSATLSGIIGAGSYVGYCLAIAASAVLTVRWGPRRVALLAGLFATVGIMVVAVAPSAPVLAVGVLIAGCSTGLASPPLAAAVARWVREGVRDTAQTVVNAGTGLGVLVSGPVALALQQQWRAAWFLFAVIAALVTVWVVRTVPSTGPAQPGDGEPEREPRVRWPAGAGALVGASFVLGSASVAVWTFGQQLVADSTDAAWLPPLVWTVIGAAGIAGAFAGPILSRLGVANSWTVLMVLLALGSAGLAVGAGRPAVALVAGSVFGASYISLSGVLLVWATRVYGRNPSTGVGLSFFTIAAGQAVAAPLLGWGSTLTTLPTVFYLSALVAAGGALLRAAPSSTAAGPG